MKPISKTQSSNVTEKLSFKLIPSFAEYILKNKLEEFVRLQIRLAINKKVPVQKFFNLADNNYTEHQLAPILIPEYLGFLNDTINNKLSERIEGLVQKRIASQLRGDSGKHSFMEDLTIESYAIKNGFYEFISDYTSDVKQSMALVREIEEYGLAVQSRYFKACIDIHLEKNNELNQQLKKHEEKLLEAQEIAHIGSFDWDLTNNGNSDYTPQVYKILERKKFTNPDDFFDFVHPDDKSKLKTAIDNAVSGKSNYDCEYRYIINGKQKVIWSRGIVEKENGKPVRVKGAIMDITDRHYILQDLDRLNHSLDQKNKELKRRNEELTSFSYVASHDLQEPLRKIKTFSNILLEKENQNLSEDGRMYLEKIDSSTLRMQKLIHDLLAFSRTQTNIDLKQKVDLNTVIEHIKNSYEDMISDKQLLINSTRLPELFAVPFQVQQLFENVIGNSVKYKKQNEPVVVDLYTEAIKKTGVPGAESDKDYYRICVKDNGIGFKNEYADKIFEIFHRLHGKAEYSGTGIGLAICKKIVENHGGFITAEGRPGEGAIFNIYFPRV